MHGLSTLLLLLLLLPLPLQAAIAPASPTEPFEVGMIRNEKGGFNYCLMRAKYDNGLTLTFALSPKNEMNVGVGVPDAGFQTSDKYEIMVDVDKAFHRGGAAVVAQPDLLIVPMGNDAKLFKALNKGSTLTLTSREDRSFFTLKGTSKGLQSLQKCVAAGVGKSKEPAAPATSSKETKAEAKTTAKGKPGTFPPALKKLLVDAGLKELQIVPVPDPDKAPVDFAWRTEGLVGGMRERRVPEEATIEKMGDLIEKGYKGQCNGTFEAKNSEIETLPGIKLRTSNISCQMAGRDAYVSLLYYITDTHLFTLFLHEGKAADKAKADGARDHLAERIRKLAHAQGSATKSQ
jgi:hypothetical protein